MAGTAGRGPTAPRTDGAADRGAGRTASPDETRASPIPAHARDPETLVTRLVVDASVVVAAICSRWGRQRGGRWDFRVLTPADFVAGLRAARTVR